MNKLILLLAFALVLFPVVSSALPEPIIQDNSRWNLLENNEPGFYPVVFDKNTHKTTFCFVSETATKSNDLKDDYTFSSITVTEKIKPKKINAENIGETKDKYGYCYDVKDNDKIIHFGENSIIYEWADSTLYVYETDKLDLDPFEIEVLCNDVKLETPDLSFISDEPITEGVKFSANISNFTCEGKLTFRQNKLIQTETTWDNQFGSQTVSHSINYADFENSELNNITSQNITTVMPDGINGFFECFMENNFVFVNEIKECMNEPRAYDQNYYGIFRDLDPSLQETITTSNDVAWKDNLTEGSNLGERTLASTLFMNFDKPADGTNIRDNGIYNNAGTNNGATYNSSCGSGAGGGCYEFDGSNDYVDFGSDTSLDLIDDFSISAWINFNNLNTKNTILGRNNGFSSNLVDVYRVELDGTLDVVFQNGITTTASYNTDTVLSPNTWYHTTLVYSNSRGYSRIYLNGIEDGSTVPNGVLDWDTDAENWRLGSWSGADQFFDGSLDNIQIFDRVLSANEILDLYNGSISGYNNTKNIGKYARKGNFSSMIFYNETETYWNVTQSIADADYIDTLEYVNQSGLVSYYRLDGDVTDSVGTNDGTNSGTTDTVGIVKKARNFDGSSHISINSRDYDFVDKSFTTNFWFKRDTMSSQEYLIVDDGFLYGWAVTMKSDGKISGFIKDSGGTGTLVAGEITTSEFDDNKWHHGSFKFTTNSAGQSGNEVIIYIDGELQSTTTDSVVGTNGYGAPPTNYFGFGARNIPTSPSSFFDGQLDEVLIFNRSLSATEISEIYDNQKKYYGVDMFEEYGVFDGSNDDVVIDDNNEMEGMPELDFSVWIKPERCGSQSAYSGVIMRKSNSYSFSLETDCKIGTYLHNGTGWTSMMKTDTAITLNEWHHINFQYDGSSYIYYIDGVEDGSGATTRTGDINTNTEDIGIGEIIGLSGYNYKGLIDEVLIFNSSLTQSEIAELYNAKFTLDDYSHDNLVSHYDMDGNFNDRVGDNDGTATGAYTTDGLVSYWTLDESFDDLVGGNDGTQSGGVVNATGISSGAMDFDGIDDYVSMGDASELEGMGELTISGWMKYDAEGVNPLLTKWDNTISTRSYILSTTTSGVDNRMIFGVSSSGANYHVEIYDKALEVDRWYHITAIYPGNESLELYIDGYEVQLDAFADSGTISGALYSSSTPVLIGSSYRDGGSQRYMNGSIDEVLIYNRSLDSSEVQNLYKAGLSQHADTNVTLYTRTADEYNLSDSGLVGLWGLNGDATDETGLNDGTNNGANLSCPECGVVGMGGDFDGVNDYINLDSAILPTDGSDFTVGLWAKTSSTNDNMYLLSQYQNSALGRSVIYYNQASNEYRFYNSGSSTLAFGQKKDNNWQYLTLTYNGTIGAYLDGVQVGTDTSLYNIVNINTLIGAGFDSDGVTPFRFYNGYIDEVRIYNRSLSASEIQDLYELGSAHIEWNDWTNDGVKEDGVALTSNQSGKFMQFRDGFITTDTDVSAYVLNYSVASGGSAVLGPTVDIVFPVNGTVYLSNITTINYTQTNGDYCWYSKDGGVTNSTAVVAGANFTSVSFSDGETTTTVYCNNSVGQIGEDNSTFTIDSPPTVIIESPLEGSIQSLTFNYTQTCSDAIGVDSQWYSWDGINYTYTETIPLSLFAGIWQVTGYCNDTSGSVNSTTVTFTTRDKTEDDTPINFTDPKLIVRNDTTNTTVFMVDSEGNVNISGFLQVNGVTTGYNASWNQAYADGIYCQTTGCTMLGDIDMNGNDILNVGNVHVQGLSGTYSSGSAYACVYDNGTLFSSESACP